MFTNTNKQTMTIKNLINLSSIPQVSTLSINFTLQTTSFPPPTFRIQLQQFCLKEFWGFFDFRFNQKIRVWGYFNWGRTLALIIGRIFGNFGVWNKDCKIRIPILYIWGRNNRWGREPLGKMTFLHFLQSSQISPWKCWLQSAILVPTYVAFDMTVHVRC